MTEIAPGGVIETDSSGRFVAVLSGLVADTEAVARAVTAAQVAEVRVLARAGRLAASEAAGQRASVREHDMVLRSIAAELGGVLRVSDRTVQQRVGEARELVESYPATLDAWEAGRITRGHVRVIVDAGRVVPVDRKAGFEAEAIRLCEGDTPNRVRAAVEILAERCAERSFTERHRTASACRRVRVIPGADGMSDLVATVPTVIAHGILDRLTQQAMVIADSRHHEGDGDGDGDTRTMDQIRADALSDMLLTGSPTLDPSAVDDRPGALGAIRAQVQVIVPALTLLDADDGPADLVGRTPVDADTARALAANAPTLTRILTDPIDGTVIAVDRYRTAQSQRRFLRARDQHCRFPGCRRAAIRCEIDHTVDHAQGGPTALGNLAHLCQRHHSMKQFTAWRVRQHPGGILEWTSPTGRVYREDAPVPLVAFTVDPPAHPPAESVPPF
ncbi:HNH endonuclease signature motif containing protein [Microbacterium hominis]|uniref:HNH endonuclease n=1 Tax=Microbacterium hominis TaxID=162426 RepID=A0A0B4CA16_9MICO|nr:HNH endonuclease signature motif containing protein [Microbacterium hominis]KIC57999.1 HNH endonuclease [Microbacterium hominis]